MMMVSGDGGRFGIFLRLPSHQNPSWFGRWTLGPAHMGLIHVWATPLFCVAWKGKAK